MLDKQSEMVKAYRSEDLQSVNQLVSKAKSDVQESLRDGLSVEVKKLEKLIAQSNSSDV